MRYSTTQDTNALVQRAGPQRCLLVADPALVEGLAATQAQEDLLTALVGDRWGPVSLDLVGSAQRVFLHPAMQRFLFNADRRLRDARARQPLRIFRRRLTACSPRPGRA
jgi:hypothetical protein